MLPQRPGDEQRYQSSSRSSYHLPPTLSPATASHPYPPPQLPPPSSGQGGHGHPDWVNERDRSNSRARWSPVLPFSDRPGSSSSARLPLPSLDYPHPRGSISSWDAPSPSGYPSWNTHNHNPRHSLPYHSHQSPPKPPTPHSDGRHAIPSQSRPPMSTRTSESSINTPQRQTSPGAKHANNDGNSPHDGQKKKKRRIALSCAECAKRKQRCNRQTPCQHCVARRVPELCVPYTRVGSPPPSRSARAAESVRDVKDEAPVNAAPATATTAVIPTGNRPPSMLPTLSVRVARIEALLNAVVNRVDGLEGKALSDWRINHAPATTPPPTQHLSISRARSDSEPKAPHTASTASYPHTGNETDRDLGYPEVAGIDLDSSMRNPIPQSMVQATEKGVPLGLDYHGTPAEQLQRLFEDCGVSPDKVSELMRELPHEDHAHRLVDWFFSKVNYVRYPIDEHVFRQSFKMIYDSPTVNARSVLSLPLIFIAFAIATKVAPDEWGMTEEEKRTQSFKMYWNSKLAIIIAQAVKAESIQLIETKILTGLYLVLMHERRLAEGWTEFRAAVTIGQALGLHRDGTKLRLDNYTTEYRRWLWSYLIHADATYSLLLGRPISIDPKCCDTLPPLNLDLPDLLLGQKPSPRPKEEPTFATYLILRRGLGEIVAKMTQHFQRLEGQTQYKDVENLDAEFKTFVANLPPAFKMLDPDKSYDDKLWFLPVHRYYIQTEILHYTIILHRPWLLRKLKSNRYSLSRTACFEAASTDFRIRQAFQRDVPDFFETLLASSFREFNVAMIAGISIIIDPRSPQSSDMRAILKRFMEQHPHDPSADSFSKKESAIIYTLYQRAKEFENKRINDSLTRSGATSIRGTQGNVSSERTEPISQPRQLGSTSPSPRLLGQNTPGESKSLHKNSPLGQTTGSGTGTSPEEDQPQQLLDHWLMSNTSFGPPLSSLDPSQPILMNPTDHNPYLSMGDPYLSDPSHGNGGGGVWIDPNNQIPGTGTNHPALLGMGGAVPNMNLVGQPMGYPSVLDGDNKSLGGGYIPGQGQGMGGWGDGNSSQYWNNLVDRIASGMEVNIEPLGS